LTSPVSYYSPPAGALVGTINIRAAANPGVILGTCQVYIEYIDAGGGGGGPSE
jgi:hypothetical protein